MFCGLSTPHYDDKTTGWYSLRRALFVEWWILYWNIEEAPNENPHFLHIMWNIWTYFREKHHQVYEDFQRKHVTLKPWCRTHVYFIWHPGRSRIAWLVQNIEPNMHAVFLCSDVFCYDLSLYSVHVLYLVSYFHKWFNSPMSCNWINYSVWSCFVHPMHYFSIPIPSCTKLFIPYIFVCSWRLYAICTF